MGFQAPNDILFRRREPVHHAGFRLRDVRLRDTFPSSPARASKGTAENSTEAEAAALTRPRHSRSFLLKKSIQDLVLAERRLCLSLWCFVSPRKAQARGAHQLERQHEFIRCSPLSRRLSSGRSILRRELCFAR